MSEPAASSPSPPDGERPSGGDYAPSVAARLALYQRAGGVVTPLLTTLVAFLVGGLVVLVTTGSFRGALNTYRAIFDGTGLNWLFHIPWNTGSLAGQHLQQTLLLVTPLILLGLAVAFAFRCGLFNIGGQGQYTVGTSVSVIVGSSFVSMPAVPHVLLAVVLAAAGGAAWAGIAGFLKATVGAHEVISTIMLNWIAFWVAQWMFGVGGPFQTSQPGLGSIPQSNDIAKGAKLHVFWGNPNLQGLHVGFFVAIAALVVFWIVLNRTTLGYEVRAVGFNPEAARYGGISVARNYFLAMAISGAFAGLAGAVDILGWEFHLDQTSIQASQVGFVAIAVALLGRNTAVGVFFAAVLFASLVTGTSSQNLDPAIFKPELAGNLTTVIQGLVVLFVGADVLIVYLWSLRRKLRL